MRRRSEVLMQEFYRLREANANATKAEALRQAQLKLLRGALHVEGEILAAREIGTKRTRARISRSLKLI